MLDTAVGMVHPAAIAARGAELQERLREENEYLKGGVAKQLSHLGGYILDYTASALIRTLSGVRGPERYTPVLNDLYHVINEHVFGGGLFKTTAEDIDWRGLENPAKVDEAHGDAIERTGAALWVVGDAAGLATIAWIDACFETKNHGTIQPPRVYLRN